MSSFQPIARNDTMLGVCQSLGEDFGFNPNYLRILFGVSLLWNPLVMLVVYPILAIVIAFSHWLFPNARPATVDEQADRRSSRTSPLETQVLARAA
jgi:phage shock protein PspC (stress-responsive transcriptional regulator)